MDIAKLYEMLEIDNIIHDIDWRDREFSREALRADERFRREKLEFEKRLEIYKRACEEVGPRRPDQSEDEYKQLLTDRVTFIRSQV